jgi:hypothetical protein
LINDERFTSSSSWFERVFAVKNPCAADVVEAYDHVSYTVLFGGDDGGALKDSPVFYPVCEWISA